ncbi:hypothetical protein ACFRAR_30495 [Kitasatospora sp. NPDC056651]
MCTRNTPSDESDLLPREPALHPASALTHRWSVDPRKRGRTVCHELDRAA